MDRVESELGFGRPRFAQLIDALPVGVFILDGKGKAIYENAAAERMLGRQIASDDRVETLASNYRAYIAGTTDPYPVDRMPIVRALGGERATVEDLEIDRDGRRMALEVTATPIHDETGAIEYAVAVFQDITERRRAQQVLATLNSELERQVAHRTRELAQSVEVLQQEISARRLFEEELMEAKAAADRANKAKSLFLMNVSHELRTPLNHIIGFNELIVDRVEDARTRKLAETAGASGRELLEKINDLIDLARAEAEPRRGSVMEFDFDALFGDVMRSIAAMTTLPRFRLDGSDRVGAMCGDADGVRRVLLEVFSSASRQSDVEDIAVALSHEPHSIVVSIPSRRLCKRLRDLGYLFGDAAPPEETRFQQHEIDFRLAIARAQARAMGGDVAVCGSGHDSVRVVLPTNLGPPPAAV